MNIVLIVVGALIGLVAIFAIYRYIKVHYQNRVLNRLRFERIKPLYEKLESGQAIDPQDVEPFAAGLLTRQMTFQLLNSRDRRELFPEEYYTLIKGAESQLANWLEFPTELDACPDEMEHIKRVTFDFDGQGNYVHYEVFKYRVNEPHWAAKDGWMLGVVGPFFDDSEPYHYAGATFSRMGRMDKISPEEEARWVHENISLRRR
ncbi:MAG TPA: hypothetical protein VIM64_12630 [Puia sp.]